MKAQDFESETPPWVDTQKWENWAKSRGVIITTGCRDNYTDGEVHYILKHGQDSFEMHSNRWNWKTSGWQESIVWVEKSYNKQINTD